MILGGIILVIAGAVVALLTFLNSAENMFSYIGKNGFGEWIARFFDLQYLTAGKVVFFVAILLAFVGLVLWLIGRNKAKNSEYRDEKTEKAVKYFRGLFSERKKIVWPDRKTVVRNTLVTIVVCAVLGALICLFDFGLSAVIDFIRNL